VQCIFYQMQKSGNPSCIKQASFVFDFYVILIVDYGMEDQ